MNNDNILGFWHTAEELEPPKGKNVWVTINPFVAVPKVRADSWDGAHWRNNRYWKTVYWAYPISMSKK